MGIFKRKNKEVQTENVTKDTKLVVLEALNDKLQGTLYDNCVIMPRGFTVDVNIGKCETRDEVYSLQVIYVIRHDDFDEPLIDPVGSQGKTLEEAAKMSVDIFFGSIWHPIQQSIQKKNPTHISVDYLNQHYDFDMYAQSIVRIGVEEEKQPTPLINYIKSELPKFLGSKKYYWIRIFLEKYKDREIIEVRINGTVCATLNSFFKDYIKSWENSDKYVSEKQCAICVQRNDDLCPFTKKTVVEAAHKAISLMEECDSAEAYQAMIGEIEKVTDGNRALAAEVRIFVPEILAKLTLGYKEGDSLFLMNDESNIEFRKTQLRSYYYIQQAILEYLQKKPEKEKVMKIVANSVAFRELKKAHEQGHEPKDLYVPGTSYKIGLEDYKVW